MDGQLGRLADLLLGRLGLLVGGDARELDQDPVLTLTRQRRLGDAERVDTAAQHAQRLVDVLRRGRGLRGALGLEDELRPALEVEPELGLDVDRQGRARGQQAENEEEPDENSA